MTDWVVPEALRDRMITKAQRAWVSNLPTIAADLAQRWGLRADGSAWSGFWSAVWPVADQTGQPLALKISTDGDGREQEAEALRRWAGQGCVRLLAHDPTQSALLLERLDGSRTLHDHRDIDEATMIIAGLLVDLDRLPAWEELRSPADLGEAMIVDIERDRPSGRLPDVVVDAALDTLRWLITVPADQCPALHGDLHFLNVLPALPGQPQRWAAIDPLPFAAPPELEPVAMLRNRFADAAATGDPDRSLRRRVDVIADHTGMDSELVRRLSQAVAVQNLPFLLAEHPDHDFVGPYELISRWT